jgi:hypothetical protein
MQGPIDLLSLDLDGVDWWIWKALDAIQPRVVVVEYQDMWGPETAVTVPYDPGFVADYGPFGPDYAGASLGAWVRLARDKGFRLVGVEPLGFNAFFVRDGEGEDVFPAVEPASCFRHPRSRHAMAERLPRVRSRGWVTV